MKYVSSAVCSAPKSICISRFTFVAKSVGLDSRYRSVLAAFMNGFSHADGEFITALDTNC